MGLTSLKTFQLTYMQISKLSQSSFAFLNLETLIISDSVINQIDMSAFEMLAVDDLYITENIIRSFSDDMFKGIDTIKLLVMDEFKFCCIRPYFLQAEKCFPQEDEFSSCSDLMRNDVLRSLIWIIGVFAIVGNGSSIIYRVMFDRARLKLGYGIFVTNLAISDFLLGINLIIIASADMHYRGEYIKHDTSWRNGVLCQFAGVLSTLSSEASVFFIALITVDRILVIKFFLGDFRITQIPATILTIGAWVIGTILSVIPFIFTEYFKGQFYSKSGLEVIKREFILRLKIKHNDWLLADTCPQSANDCALF